MPSTFGLIDGNAFYCSCDRAFSPKLRGRAVVVLSNTLDDGGPLLPEPAVLLPPQRPGEEVVGDYAPAQTN